RDLVDSILDSSAELIQVRLENSKSGDAFFLFLFQVEFVDCLCSLIPPSLQFFQCGAPPKHEWTVSSLSKAAERRDGIGRLNEDLSQQVTQPRRSGDAIII